jgi:hypothetical protein
MEILAGSLDWTPNDSERLAAFLDSETGKRFIPKLVEAAPTLFDAGDTNRILIRSGEVLSFQKIVKEILFLAHPPPPNKQEATEYPPLESDTHWNDGQKIEPETKPEGVDPLSL